jgi:hypothetical protein
MMRKALHSLHIPPAARLFIGALFILIAQGCKKGKEVTATQEPLRDKPAGAILRSYERNEFRFDWVAMKVDAEVTAAEESRSFKANIRMRRDSVIWISLSPALGIEVFRVLITPDSLRYISRIPDNKHYYTGGLHALNDLIGVDMEFSMFQDLLVGNAIGLDREEGKFRCEVDGDRYLLTSKYRRKVRRVVGVDDRRLSEEDSIQVRADDPRLRRAIRRADEEDLIISRYWVDGENFRLMKSIFNDLVRQRSVEVEYSEFQQEESGQYYPSRCLMVIRDPERQQHIAFRITKIATGKTYDFPFEIPEDFERKLSP